MKNEYKIITDLDKLDNTFWENVAKCRNANFFQTFKAINFFKDRGYDILIVAVFRNNVYKTHMCAVIQKEPGIQAYFSRRAIVFGGPVFSDDIEENDISTLLKEVKKEVSNKAIYIEIRNFNDYSSYKQVFEAYGFNYIAHLNFHLDSTGGEENVMKRVSKSKRSLIRRALREGVEIIEAENKRQIVSYHEILENLYKTKVKTPLSKLDFFIDLYEQKVAKFLLLRYNNEIIGGIVITELDKRVVYEWYVCGKDFEYKNLGPSTLATWAGINYAVKNGITRFDFMGAGKPDESYGVRDFKARFGGELVEHGRYVFVAKPFLYWLGTKAVSIKKKL